MAKRIDPAKEAIERLKEAAFHPEMDAVWEKHPVVYAPGDLQRLVAVLRTERALWKATEERRAQRKAHGNGDPPEPAEDGGDAW